MKEYQLGEFEEVVLLTAAILHGDAYGINIKREIEVRLDRSVSIGALQSALKRMEKKGYLQSILGEATAIRGGKRKRYYQITPYGIKALESAKESRNNLWNAIPKVAFEFNR